MENQNQQKQSADVKSHTLQSTVEGKLYESEAPTNQILLKAHTNSEWDHIDFALIEIYPELPNILEQAMTLIQQSASIASFRHLSISDGECSFHIIDDDEDLLVALLEKIEDESRDYIYVRNANRKILPRPEQWLVYEGIQINSNGWVSFHAYGKHTGEEYWTDSIHYTKLNFMNPVAFSY